MSNKKKKRNKSYGAKASNKLSGKKKVSLEISSSTEFVLENFEQLVYGGHYIKAVNYLLRLLRTFNTFTLIARDGESSEEYMGRKRRWATRLAAACCALFSSPNWVITDDVYFYVSRFHDWLSKIYELSYVKDGNYVLDLVSSTQFSSQEQMLKRLYLHVSLNSPVEVYQVLLTDTTLSLPITLSMAGDSCTVNQHQEQNRSTVLQNFNALSEGATLYDQFVGGIHKPWMFCSYAVDEHRHLAKMGINNIISGLFSEVKPSKRRHSEQERPKLAVLVEVCRHDHAMFRCYGPLLASLKDYFDVTFVATQDSIDAQVAMLADRVQYIDYGKSSMQNIAEQIRDSDFDMIYYPSLGMSTWTIIMANLRLAPVQCFTMGHPATSCSKEIDFVLMEKDGVSDPLCFTEKMVVADGYPPFNPHPSELGSYDLKLSEEDGIVRVAIVSKYMKINLLLVEFCRSLIETCQTSIEFHFFPSAKGVLLDYIELSLVSQLPGSKVHPYMDYVAYMAVMSNCDIRIGTFPFGGANTTVDCIALGIPFLTLDGPETFNHVDTASIRRYCPQLEENLAAGDFEQLVQKAARLVDDKDYRNSISKELKAIDLDSIVYSRREDAIADNKGVGVTGETIFWAYKNAPSIISSDSQVTEVPFQPLANT